MRMQDASPGTIDEVWRSRWGLPVIAARRNYMPADCAGLELVDDGGARLGLVTWARDGARAEIVTLDALVEGQGHGSRLLAEAERRLAAEGIASVRLTTTNDNLRAFGFYARRGYRLYRIERDAMDEVREQKPQVPRVGQHGIALTDLWELEKELVPGGIAREAHHALTILAVVDLERAVAFYRRAFGWPARVEVPVYVELELPDGRGLGLYRASAFSANTGQSPSAPPAQGTTATELYLHVDDVRAMTARVEGAGGRLLSAAAPRPWGDLVSYLADPEGNVIALARPGAA